MLSCVYFCLLYNLEFLQWYPCLYIYSKSVLPNFEKNHYLTINSRTSFADFPNAQRLKCPAILQVATFSIVPKRILTIQARNAHARAPQKARSVSYLLLQVWLLLKSGTIAYFPRIIYTHLLYLSEWLLRRVLLVFVGARTHEAKRISLMFPCLSRGSNFFYNSFNETRTDDMSPDFASDNVSFSCISPELLQLQRSRFRGMPAPKRTAPTNEQQQQNKRPRRSLEKAKRNVFKPCFVSRALYTPPGSKQNLFTPEIQHTGADSRPCSPQSQEIQRIMGRWPVTRPESCCFVPLSPCLPFRPRGGSLRNNSP